MTCQHYEELASDYLENTLTANDRRAMDTHLQSCSACSELLAGISEVMAAAKVFPVYESPAWLASRIVANTPHIARESWMDTIAAMWKALIEPRTAMAIFTAVMVLGWLGGMAGISPNWSSAVRNPSIIYYDAHSFLNHAYDEAIRKYYRSPLVTEIQSRLEQIREIS
jgi:predicted anti-sigma-YlaC factor YlaD